MDNVRKYLLYSIGEILLVVIGILIALQVNNWNENRKELDQERRILNTLQQEFTENLVELKYDIARLDTTNKNLLSILELIGTSHSTNETESDSLLFHALDNPTWNPSSYVLNDLKNSGQLSKLTNRDLQDALFKWERHYEDLQEYTVNTKNSNIALLEYLREYSSLRNIDSASQLVPLTRSKLGFNNQALLKEIRFENVIDDKYMTTHELLERYTLTKEIIEDIIKIISN